MSVFPELPECHAVPCSTKRSTARNTTRAAMLLAGVLSCLAACTTPEKADDRIPGVIRPAELSPLRSADKDGTKDVDIRFTEGTNIAVSPSPDGTMFVMSAQGALWLLRAQGGPATRLTGWDVEATHPVWSPDGKTIAFQAYTPEGNYHIWTIGPRGGLPRPLTSGAFDDREPSWSADGRSMVFSSDRSGDGQLKIWSIDIASGRLRKLTVSDGNEQNPVLSPDGRELYWSDRNRIFHMPVAGGVEPKQVGDGRVPSLSRDGRTLIAQNAKGNLMLGDREITQGEDLFPFPVRWMPDGRMVYTADGRIRIRDADGGNARELPFSATLSLRRPVVRPKRDHGFDRREPQPVKGISAPALSPDGRQVAFIALNDVWVMPIGGEPRRLTHDVDLDGTPQFTPDGKAVYFATEKGNAGQLAIDSIDLSTNTRSRLAATAGRSMVTPMMSPDGTKIAYQTGYGTIEVWDLRARRAQKIIDAVGWQVSTPQWLPDSRRLIVVDNQRINPQYREGTNKLRIIDTVEKTAQFRAVADAPRQISDREEGAATVSPDGRRVAFIMDSRLHVMSLAADGSPEGTPRRLTDEVADLPSWAGDSQTLLYKSANELRLVSAIDGRTQKVPVPLRWKQAIPEQTTIVHAGALWDGRSEQLRRNVDIVIDGNRIREVAPHDEARRASGARWVDASARTVMPGLFDPHVHPLTLYQGGQFGQVAAAMLAYGITSTQSVAGPSHMSVELREAIAAGNLRAPRLFISPPLWEGNRQFYSFARTLRTPEIADLEIAKAKAMEVDYLKSYVRGPIPNMQRIAQAGVDMGIPTGTHMIAPGAALGIAGTTHLSATQRMGYGWSKSFPGLITYQDAADIHAKADLHLVDTLFSSTVLAHRNRELLGDERGRYLMLPNFHDMFVNGAPANPEQLAKLKRDSEQQAKVRRAGALVAIGTDTPLVPPGIALHTNMWGAAQTASNFEVLQGVTINAAKTSYVDRDLGTIEAGKLADMIFITGDPLQDIKAVATVDTVMRNGEVLTREQIIAPFKSKEAVASRDAALAEFRAQCGEEAVHASALRAEACAHISAHGH